jgi:hypothetical protein
MEAQRAYNGQTLCKVETQLTPLEDVGTCQTKKVTCARVVYIERRTVEITGSPGLGADLTALVDEGEM